MPMDYVKISRQCEQTAAALGEAEDMMSETFSRLGLVRPGEDWEQLTGPKVDKISGGVVICDSNGLSELRDLGELRIGVQIQKINQNFYGEGVQEFRRVAVPGGAIQSNEEREAIHSGRVPAGDVQRAFYYVAENQLFNEGRLHMSYDLEAGARDLIRAEVLRRVVNEMGEAAAASLELVALLPGRKTSVLPNIMLIDAQRTQVIAERLAAQGVKNPAERKLTGVYTRVNEGALAARAQLGRVMEEAADNEHEKGVRIMSVAELVRVAQSTASERGYTRYRRLYPNDYHDGLRNPSAAFLLGEFVRWIGRSAEEQDPYRDASPKKNPFAPAAPERS